MSATGPMPGLGDVVSGYRIDEVVGTGGMGTVYRATHERLGREVAVKILRPELASDSVYRERFEREARIAAQLEHPNIVPILDFGDQEGVLYLVMRFIRGHDLRSLLGRVRRLDARQTIEILRQVAAGLDAAHAQGLVHRDVKPANVLVAAASGSQRAGHAYLTDFGIAKDMSAGAGLTAPGTFVGTRHYASPEQIDAKPVDGRADQYALACIAYECLTGSAPYDRDSDSAIMLAHLLEAPPSARAVLGTLPEGVDAVLGRALAKSPAERFQTCTEMIDALDRQLVPEVPETPAPASPAAPIQESATPGADETGIRLDRQAETPGKRGETELLPGGERQPAGVRREEAPPAPVEPSPPPAVQPPAAPETPSRRKTPRQSVVESVPARKGWPGWRRPVGAHELMLAGAGVLALAGLAALAVGIATRGGDGGKGNPPAVVGPRAASDSLVLAGRQRYTIAASRLTGNDKGRSLTIVGVAGGPSLHGAVSLRNRGSELAYVPDAGYSGVARFTYTVRDAAGKLGVGTVRLRIEGFTAAQQRLLSYVPAAMVPSCIAAPAGGAVAAVSCRSALGDVVFVAYASTKLADAAFARAFDQPEGDCAKGSATGTWYWPETPKRDAGRYGCAVVGKRAVFGWTYGPAPYLARATGKPGVTLAALDRWFFAGLRLKR